MKPSADAPDPAAATEPPARPWVVLQSQPEIEAWIERLNHELQQIEYARRNAGRTVELDHNRGYGVRLTLTHGGAVRLHTNPDGDILLDVSADAAWLAPLLMAATGAPAPRGTLWLIPGERLVELMTGLNSLIESEQLLVRRQLRGQR